MKKTILSLFALLFSVYSFSQKEVCIKEKWIAVSNDSTNAHLFEGNQNLNDTLSIFQEIRKLVNSRKISLYCGNTGWCKTSTRQYINHQLSSEFWSNEYDSLYEYNPFFEFSIQSDFPLVDEHGEPIIVTDTNGFQMYVYPPRTIESIHLRDIYELQIVEVYREGKFVPSRIGFCTVEDGNITELFWMDIKSVKKASTNRALTNWIEDIQNKKYSGFQFKQAQCTDQYKR